jgi:uncharacterized protein YheU (UPF0270 family)
MDIPWEELQPETLRSMTEEYVTRDGTDYGIAEADFQTKIRQVQKLLNSKRLKIVFDAETESCDFREVLPQGNKHQS